jgi:hypothetical protein
MAMPGQLLHSADLDRLRTALSEALPQHAVIRMSDDDGLSSVDVHAWWKVGTHGGGRQVNSLSFRLTSSMVQAYLRLQESEREAVCHRLTAWVTWAVDSAPRKFDGWLGFDINAAIPLSVFFPQYPGENRLSSF